MRTTIPVLVLILAVPSPGSAQAVGPARVGLEVRAGYTRPTRDLGRTDVLDGRGYVAFETAQSAATLGAAVAAHLYGPLHARLRADYVAEAGVDGQWYCEGLTPCPAVLILVDGRMRRWSVGADLELRPDLRGWPFDPTAFVGVGRGSTRMRWDSELPEVPIPDAYDHSGAFFRVGLGISRAVGPGAVFVETEGIFTSFGQELPLFVEGVNPPDNLGDPRTQVDFGVALGFRIGVWRPGAGR